MKSENTSVAKNAATIIVVDAPEVSLAPDEMAGDLLLHFYRALGWNGEDILDPCKIRTTQEVYDNLRNQMCESCDDRVSVSMFLLNKGPGVGSHIPTGKVYLLEGWTAPAPKEGDDSDAA